MNRWELATYIAAALWGTVEIYLGIKRPMDSGTLPQLLWKLITRFRKQPQEVAPVPTNPNPNAISLQVVVDGPTYRALGVVTDMIKAITSGQDAKEAVLAISPRLIEAFGDLSKISPDYKIDKTSVVEAVSQRLGDMVESFVLARSADPK